MQVTNIALAEVNREWKDIIRPIGGLRDPYYNIIIGYRYLYYLRMVYLEQDKFKDMSEMEKNVKFIIMYNFGPFHKEVKRSSINQLMKYKYYKNITKRL